MHYTSLIISCFGITVTAFSAEWTDGSFTAMKLSWEPVTAPEGAAALYTVSFSPVNASGIIDSAATMQKQTMSSTVTVSGLNPTAWYYFQLEIEENAAGPDSSTIASGVGIGKFAHTADSTEFMFQSLFLFRCCRCLYFHHWCGDRPTAVLLHSLVSFMPFSHRVQLHTFCPKCNFYIAENNMPVL